MCFVAIVPAAEVAGNEGAMYGVTGCVTLRGEYRVGCPSKPTAVVGKMRHAGDEMAVWLVLRRMIAEALRTVDACLQRERCPRGFKLLIRVDRLPQRAAVACRDSKRP